MIRLQFLVTFLFMCMPASGAPADTSERPLLFYINLDRRPDRRNFMENQFEHRGISNEFKVIRFCARDGATTSYTSEELDYFKECDFKENYNFNVLVANQLSHIGVWQDLLRLGAEYAVVIQDDAELSEDFSEVVHHIMEHARPVDTAVIWLGLHRFADRSFSLPFPLASNYDPNVFSDPVDGNAAVGTANWNPCSLAYIITRSGAQELLDYFRANGIKRATDNAMIDALKQPRPGSVKHGEEGALKNNRNYISRRVVATGHIRFMHDSDIFASQDQPSLAPEYGRAFTEALAQQRRDQSQTPEQESNVAGNIIQHDLSGYSHSGVDEEKRAPTEL